MLKRYMNSPASLLGLVLLILVGGMALTANVFYPEDPLGLAGAPLQWPFASSEFWLGTDGSGRDIAAQIFHGARISLLIGIVATGFAMTLGVMIGAIAGYYGGWLDDLLMRLTEAFQTVPSFLLLLVCVVVFGSDLVVVTIAIGAVSWTAPARLTRAEFLTLRQREFVQASQTIGLSDRWIIFREILPNALPPIVVYASVVMANAILMESALAFLEQSDPNIASWGNLIGQGKALIRSEWYVSVIPGIAIFITVLTVSLVGQGINDVLNPRLKGK